MKRELKILNKIKKIFINNKEKNKKECDKCLNYKTMTCPNSYYCYSTDNKPYYKSKEE